MRIFSTDETLGFAMEHYENGINTLQPQHFRVGLGMLLSLTCPYDPLTGEQAILTPSQGARFLEGLPVFQTAMVGEHDFDKHDFMWLDVAERVYKYTFHIDTTTDIEDGWLEAIEQALTAEEADELAK